MRYSPRAKSRQPAKSTYSPNSTVKETIPVGVVEGINFTVTQQSSLSGAYVNHFHPDAGPATPLDPAIYANTSLAAQIDSSYSFGHLVAGNNVVVNNAAPALSDPTINISANTNVLGSGYVHVLTNGNIGVIETAGDLRIDILRSNEGDVSATANAGSIYEIAGAGDEAEPRPGSSVTASPCARNWAPSATSTTSSRSIRRSRRRVKSMRWRTAVFLREVAGDLNIGGIASKENDVMLITLSGSMFDADDDIVSDIQGRNIDLVLRRGRHDRQRC
ncbi:MAG: hypothetical protein MZV64_15750 [Ignavibacteriales bacterium]|nr:hypothetical protein [Ignavibacteriales bacterium]